jgi:hypothetical protein
MVASPSASGARLTLAVILGGLAALQLASVPLGHYYAGRIEGIAPGSVTYEQWRDYTAEARAPDILFVGDSRAFADVDEIQLATLVGGRLGSSVRVGKFGVNGADAAVLEALVYRVMSRPSRPRLIVYALAEFQFNANYGRDFTSDYWQISDPPDLGYLDEAFRLDPDRGRLARGLLLPAIANLPLITQGLACDIGRIRPVPGCRFGGNQNPAAFRAEFKQSYLRDFSYSDQQERYVSETVGRIRAGGAQVAFVVFPTDGIDSVDPPAYAMFQTRTRALAVREGAQMLDMHSDVPDQPGLWADLLHLTKTGRSQITPKLAEFCFANYQPAASQASFSAEPARMA